MQVETSTGQQSSVLVTSRAHPHRVYGQKRIACQTKAHPLQSEMAKFTRLVSPQKTTSISILLCDPHLKVHLLNVGLQADTVPSESQEGLEQVDLQVRSDFELAVQGCLSVSR
ncbi:hypothetical protein T12_2095 [Trichinella patagoniensis]|uniref:Uncharacterized protein n=1 Tax=Trichinella patagoniensis TaxID=990121 RepID=A0A0V0YVC9_9BILA|nr:hypothetical protein T12_2095 [Trichinella patagoniensis]